MDLNGIKKTSFGLESPQLDFQYQESIKRYIQLKMCYQIILRRLILNKSGCLKTKSELTGELVTTFQMMKPQIHFQYLLRFQRNLSRNFVWKFSRSDIFSHVTKGSKVNSVHRSCNVYCKKAHHTAQPDTLFWNAGVNISPYFLDARQGKGFGFLSHLGQGF